ncbi:MFS transporter [Pseudovibrio sp. SPO723]|uniref:MFS transporter n=1 Tax=Nesiotobacter zosterae TaxID=392721 RepID=UPI0029C18210|nr:MFS transporter [Pseudovibrio sp. SPO723]MDX5594270.1 MFS transporter [Pseudovibrio sp. SPO723]
MKTAPDWLRLARNHDYRLLWLGQTISTFGESIYQVAFYWLAYEMTESAWLAGLVVFCASAPYLLFGLIGGVYADKWNRKSLMLFCDLIRAVAVAVVPALALAGMLTVWHLALIAFVLTSARCFFHPSLNAAVAGVLDDDTRALGVSLVEGGFRAARLIGLALGGILIELWGADQLYTIAIVTFFVSIGFVVPLRNVGHAEGEESEDNLLGALGGTLRFLQGHRDLFWGIILFGVGLMFVTGLERVALPHVADQNWGAGASGFGWVLAMITIGYVFASLVIGRLQIKNPSLYIFGGWALWGVFFAALGLSENIWIALSFALLVGAVEAVVDIPLVVLIQTKTPGSRMGKVFSMWSTVAFIGESLSALMIGALISQSTAPAAFIMCAAGTVAMAIFGLIASRSRASDEPQALEGGKS